MSEERKKVVILGGGSGSSRVLLSLKELPIDITAVVTVADDGRSTGALRKEFSVPGIGDIRKVLTHLSTLPDDVKSIMEYRLSTYSDLNNHAMGNLLLISYLKQTGSLEKSIENYSRLMRVKQTVLPISDDADITLMAEMEDGSTVEGEAEITESPLHAKRIFYKKEPHVVARVIDAIREADLVIVSMGSLYTSILPTLICSEVQKAIHESSAKLMYLCNAMTQPGETDGFNVSDHVHVLEQYLGKDVFDVVVASNTVIEEEMLRKYETAEQKEQVPVDSEAASSNYELIVSDLLTTAEGKITHNSLKLSSVIFSYLMR